MENEQHLQLFKPVHSEEWLNEFLSKKYYKKPYDRFMWWRSYTAKKKPLHKRCCLRDKVKNGDYDMGPYNYELQLVEHKLNRTYKSCYPDMGKYLELESVNLARRKRLFQDYTKDEATKLDAFYADFKAEFRITKEQLEADLMEQDFETLLKFYDYCEKKYRKKLFR
jgi:hypothetical protein